jgi:hypothetical protein
MLTGPVAEVRNLNRELGSNRLVAEVAAARGPFCNRLIGDRRGDLSALDGAKGASIFDCRDKDAGIALIFSIKLATSGGDHRRLGQSSSPQR